MKQPLIISAIALASACAATGPDSLDGPPAAVSPGEYSVAMTCVSGCDPGPPLDGALGLKIREDFHLFYRGPGWVFDQPCAADGYCISCGSAPIDPTNVDTMWSDDYELCPAGGSATASISWPGSSWEMTIETTDDPPAILSPRS